MAENKKLNGVEADALEAAFNKSVSNTPTRFPESQVGQSPEGQDELKEDEVKEIEKMALETCRLANTERRLLIKAAELIDRYRLVAPSRDLNFTKSKCEEWFKDFAELKQSFTIKRNP